MSNVGHSFVAGPAPRRRLGDHIIERLREAILRGEFAPGERLREEQLARAFDVSRGPIRVALTELEREGLVRLRAHRGATVRQLSRVDIQEVYSLRLALDTLSIRYATVRADDSDLMALEATLGGFGNQLERGTSSAYDVARLDIEFHDAIYGVANHERLGRCWAMLRSQVYLFLLHRNLSSPDVCQRFVSDHQRILQAIASRDEDVAVRAIEVHVSEPYLGLLEVVGASETDDGAPDSSGLRSLEPEVSQVLPDVDVRLAGSGRRYVLPFSDKGGEN